MHHIVTDEWSIRVLVREVARLYEAFVKGEESPLPELGIQYADYAVWQREWLQGEILEGQLKYWREQLKDVPVLEMPTDHPRPAVASHRGAGVPVQISREVLKGLKELSGQEGMTLFMVLLAGFQVMLSRYSGQEDVAVGAPISNRTRAELEELIGFFVNTVVLRVDLSGDPSVREMLRRVREVCLGAYAHQDLPFERLVEDLNPKRDLSREPLFQVMLVLQNAPIGELRMGGLELTGVPQEGVTAKFDLTLSMGESEEGLRGVMEYATDLYERATIERMLGHWERVLEEMVAKPEERISEIKMMREEERRQVVEEWNETEREYEKDRSIQELFEEQVKRTPEATAVIFEGAELSYEELNRRANQVGHYLRGLGVGAEERVGICVERSLEMVVGLLGILKAGGAYVPLDPEYPPERLGYMLEDARVPVLLTQERIRERLPESDARIVELDKEWEQIARESSEDLPSVTEGENAAYVMYTSGSTGRPKGVVVTHGGLTNYLLWGAGNYAMEGRAGAPIHSSISFDLTITSLYVPLIRGDHIILFGNKKNIEEVTDTLAASRDLGLLKVTPSHLEALTLHGAGAFRGVVQVLIIGGEALSQQQLMKWREECPETRLINEYGPTETVVGCCSYEVAERDALSGSVPIGRPIANTQMYVLDLDLHPVPVGVAGELYIGGAGLGRGYLNQPGMTAEKFVANPYSKESGARMYRTGDLGRWRTDGELEFLGRIDEQVKIRGYRIEPGEIEAVLREQGGVREAAVVAREEEGQKRLVAYVVWEEGDGKPSVGELRKVLQGRLPEYMVPSAFVFLERLPLTANGKLDRRALPKPGERPEQGREYVGPRTAVEEILCGIWAKVLGLERVGVEDNFFELGGDSILSIQVVAQAKQAGLRFSLRELFEKQTVARLAQALGSGEGGDDVFVSTSKPFSMISEEDRRNLPEGIEDAYPLARLQGGMLYHSEYSPETPIYHDLFHYHLRTRLEIDALRQAIEGVLGRHAVLRTSFDLSSYGEPLQLVHARSDVVVELEDISDLSVTRQEEVLQEWVEAEKRRPFDLSQAGLLRFQIHRRTPETFQFTLSFHHAILDGWSTASLLTEIFRSYFSILEGKGKVIAAPVSCYREFVELERRTLQSEETQKYWAQQLSEVNIPRMPWKAAGEIAPEIRTLQVPISQGLSEKLKKLSWDLGVSLKSVTLAAHLRVMSLISGQEDVVTGLVSNGRLEAEDGERVLGLFLNTLPFRVQLQGGSWIDLIGKVATAEHSLLAHRRYPLSELQRMVGVPLFETAFNFTHFHVYRGLQNVAELEVIQGGGVDQTNFKFLAQFQLDVTTSDLRFQLDYDGSVIEQTQITTIAEYYQKVMEEMVCGPEQHYELTCLLSEEERRQVVEEWNETEREYEKDRSIQELFEEQVKRTPEATAVIFEGAELSYEELNRRANQVGHYLRGLGVGAEVRVGICVERSLEMVVGLLGILKAGGAYVPLDPEYPPERLGYMLEDARVPVLLTQERIRERLPESDARIVELDKEWEQIARESSEDLPSVTAGENAAYVMYTSGSTGRPKGVVMLHGVLANLIGWHNQVLRPRARTLQFASLSFDASFHEMFSAWCSGGTLIIVEESLRADFAALGGFIVRNKIEKATLPVVMLHGIAEEYRNSPSGVGSLREVITTGEQLQITPSVVDVFRRHPQCSLHNHYGPSETHVVTASTLPAQAESWVVQPPIGRPIANTQMYVLDLDLHPVPVGVAGELYIGGAGLGRGYLNQPGMTAEKFVANPYSKESGARMYRTGDLGRWRTDGELEFLGRIDEQVKIRGYRIEPGEIEAVLREQGGVREAAVVAREEEGQKRLVAYVVWEEGDGKPSVGELRKVLQGRLPEYMVPSAFVFLERLPLTANGKLDRRALPKPGERPEQGREYVGPRTAVEEILCGIWAKVLGLERVGVEDNFFELGGHSLLATQAVSQAKQAGLRFSLRELFEKQTVARLAQALGSGEGGDDVFVSTSKPFSMISEEDRRNLPEGIEDAYPLARLQGGMLYHSEYSPETPIYHDLFHYHLRTRLEIDALRQAIEGVLGRHAVLRTSFDLSSYGEPLQLVHARSDVVVELEDISDLSVTRQEEVLQEWVEAEKRRPFDLSQAGLLRFQIHRRTPETFQFTLSFHHAILDGWSTASLLTEIFRSYFSILEGKGKVIAAPVSCYREFVELERRTLQSEETQKYWAQQLSEVNIPRMPWKI